MQLKKNTKAFKTIKEIFTAVQDKADRQKLIRLYITRAGNSIGERIHVESLADDAELFYNMNYEAILNNLQSSDRQLYESDDVAGIYFFHSTSNKTWDETPFEFDESIVKIFQNLPELPTTRKKEKPGKFALPTMPVAKVKAGSKDDTKTKPAPEPKKAQELIPRKPANLPDYGLKHQIEFTNLTQTVFREPRLSKKDILDYFNLIAEHILPYLKDKPLTVRAILNGKHVEYNSTSELPEYFDFPEWSKLRSEANKNGGEVLVCNNKEHLLLLVEFGAVQFNAALSKAKSATLPEYIIIAIESPDNEIRKAVAVALAAKEILNGLRLPSFIKSDGLSGLHVYIPLDSKSEAKTCHHVAEYLCKLIQIKRPDETVLEGSKDNGYGKVALEYSFNEGDKRVIAPYSLTLADFPAIAAPLEWSELTDDLQLMDFNIQTIDKRLKQKGDAFLSLFKKKVNADELLARLKEHYTFLF